MRKSYPPATDELLGRRARGSDPTQRVSDEDFTKERPSSHLAAVLVPDYVTLGERYEAEVYAAVSFSAGIEIDGALPRFVDQRSRLLVRMRSAEGEAGQERSVSVRERKERQAVLRRSLVVSCPGSGARKIPGLPRRARRAHTNTITLLLFRRREYIRQAPIVSAPSLLRTRIGCGCHSTEGHASPAVG